MARMVKATFAYHKTASAIVVNACVKRNVQNKD